MLKFKNHKWLLVVICAVLLGGAFFSFQHTKVAHATSYFVPPSWNGEQCDNTHFNSHTGLTAAPLGTSFMGIDACGPRPGITMPRAYDEYITTYASTPTMESEYEFECVELSMRFMYLVYGTIPYSAPGGADVFYNYGVVSSPGGVPLTKVYNGTVGKAPHRGDILGYGSAGGGHTSVVIAVSPNGGAGNYTVKVMEQNNAGDTNGTDTLTMSNWTLTGGTSGQAVDGWLTAFTSVDPSSSWNTLNGVKAIASNNVYAVGSSTPSGGLHSYQALVEKYNGTSWSQITSGNAVDYDIELFAVDADSASDVWAVGENVTNGQSYVLKYNGTSWSKVTSVPNIGQLSGVRVFSSTNVWVAGWSQVAHYTSGSWTTYSPPGIGVVTSIGGDSASDVWITGSAYSKSYVAYWITGAANFTEVTSEPNPANNSGDSDTLTGIYVFSSGNVWVVGYATPSSTYIPYGFVAKWDGSTWTTNSFASGSQLYGISASSTSNIRVVGLTGSSDAYAQKSTGSLTSWSPLYTPAPNQLNAISAVSSDGSSWAVGIDSPTSRTIAERFL